MTPNLVLCLLVGVLFAAGTYLLLARSISRALIGILMLGNGANILFLVASGPAGRAPISSTATEAEMADPLPQAFVLTAIVITLGLMGFILAMAHRSWQLSRSDVVEDDVEDRRIARKAHDDDLTGSDFADDTPDLEPGVVDMPPDPHGEPAGSADTGEGEHGDSARSSDR